MKDRDGGGLDGDFISLRKKVVKGGEVVADDECRAGGCAGCVWEGRRRVRKKEVLKRGVSEGRERMSGEMRNGGDGSGREEMVKGGEMAVEMKAKDFVYGDEVREEGVFAITSEKWFMDWE